MYYEKFIKISLQYVRGYNNVEDIVSEVFIKILNGIDKIKTIDRVEAYLFTMVKNQCLDFLKKKNNKSLVLIDDYEDNFLVESGDLRIEIEGNELSTVINNCIAQYPPKRKMVYRLIKEERLKYKEVAVILSISPKTVEHHLELALKSLREVLELFYKDAGVDTPIRYIQRRKNI